MITDELKYRIRNAFAFTPTTEQEQAIEVFTQFMTDRHEQALMILRGSAGTGKTTLAHLRGVLRRCSRSMPTMLPQLSIGASIVRNRWRALSD